MPSDGVMDTLVNGARGAPALVQATFTRLPVLPVPGEHLKLAVSHGTPRKIIRNEIQLLHTIILSAYSIHLRRALPPLLSARSTGS
jgi:hypothetical protein